MLGQRHHAVVAVPQKTKAGFYFVYKKGGGVRWDSSLYGFEAENNSVRYAFCTGGSKKTWLSVLGALAAVQSGFSALVIRRTFTRV